jgi:hypothetical protein
VAREKIRRLTNKRHRREEKKSIREASRLPYQYYGIISSHDFTGNITETDIRGIRFAVFGVMESHRWKPSQR